MRYVRFGPVWRKRHTSGTVRLRTCAVSVGTVTSEGGGNGNPTLRGGCGSDTARTATVR